ncbi:NDR1/HIN1-like protein 10 [Cicer arietinum]|uniref:NDR1/HIN1-like protein 10 n=1 Tax=Cicer arietinum TaxID=3827 RepID=A0A1S2XUY0_CICAR|nr:NDR1/HIN1-like protein 10 [Cicer arietinum]
MQQQQPQLNDAYYGPTIPLAPRQNYYSNNRNRSCCNRLWKLLITLIILFGLVILIFYLIVQPRAFKFYVTESKLTQFDYTNNTLHYNMLLNFTAHNPNKKLSIYYDKVVARAFYQGSRFANVDVITHMNSFRQDKNKNDSMSGVFSGQKVLILDNDQVTELKKDKNVGVYDIYVKLYFRIRFRLGDSVSSKYKPKVKCHLAVPFSSSNATGFTFKRLLPTKCDVEF